MGLPLLVGLIHVALIAPRYHVGSFDDDASYILTAKALLAGQGLTGHLASGEVVVGLYAPGFSALIAPLVWLWPHTFIPLRLGSVACFAAVFPLTWIFLRRRRIGPGARTAVLFLLALGPPFATYGSMVMAEAPFLVVLLLLLLCLDRWLEADRLLSGWGLAMVASAAGLIWLKEAGLGLVAGLFLWLLLGRHSRRLARAAVLAAGVGATLAPVIVARAIAGIPLAGSRYSMELGAFYQGGLAGRLRQVFPHSLWHLLSTAIPATFVPYLEPLPIAGRWPDLWKVLSWHVTVLAAVGAVVWARRYRDAAVPMVVVYLLESSLWPFVNERRAILVLPVLAAWYVVGAVWVWRALRHGLDRLASVRARRWPEAGAAVLAAAVVAGPLVAQMPRDYLFSWGQSSSQMGGSRYAELLAHAGTAADVVETDYRSTTALFTGHATNWTAFVDTQGICYLPGILQALSSDRASYLLLGDMNKPGILDSPCLAGEVDGAAWAVPLLHSRRDDASVYELIGPGTGHPGLFDPSHGQAPTIVETSSGAAGVISFSRPARLSQVSVGEAHVGFPLSRAPGTSVSLQILRPDGTWQPVATAAGQVGDGGIPYLMESFAEPVTASAVRVVVRAPDPQAGSAVIDDLAAIGPSLGSGSVPGS